ncbi:MAG: NERD domain-containing protein [Chloroflexi bacterium]|nr:MAG: NERD domain-containing protein [Chloroflexota bacterium]
MRNVAPYASLVRRSRQFLLVAFVVAAAGVFFAIVGLGLFVIPFAVPGNQGFELYHVVRTAMFLGGGALGLFGVLLAVRAITWKTDNDLAQITAAYLSEYFDERFTLIRNVSRIGLGYIDAVLVGPPGVLVFRLVDKHGSFLNDRGKWLKLNKRNQWVPMRFNPTKDTADDVRNLRKYLASKDIQDIPVYGVVVFIPDEQHAHIQAEAPVVPVANLPHLYDALLDNYLAKPERITSDQISSVVNLLYRE